MRWIAFALLLLWVSTTAQAGLTPAELEDVRADPPEHARVDLGTERPTVLIFADYDCGALCDAILAQTAETLVQSRLTLGVDYALVIIGLDPRDGAEAARAFVAAQSGRLDALQIDARRPSEARLRMLSETLGYHVRYDAEVDRFAHASARYVLTADGRVSRVLPAFRAAPGDLRKALVEAGEGRVGGTFERLALACYGFDPETGRYSLSVARAAIFGGGASTLLLGGGILIALRRERRERQL